ncbi:hypothetical protein PAECIP111893_00302 [Paenibacillus plantiphilus]|uniref:HTH cro/C1-type domain-containing protein n=1 Tax=Paenibacillus plantiphilus TaxID=2905650 RepID=A0ABM9BNZ5_9BACL|nr:helix-turn-helix transcriptional regulator [Paenibacillus plantiphilus]CAH1190378.1 hypothetical protein PAECIP111893_00302 [Paenibacillus plantiphilus]
MANPIRCRVPEILARKGQTQIWLAGETGLPKQRLSDYCTMRRMMSIQTAKLIADVLKVSVESLYEWEGEQQE